MKTVRERNGMKRNAIQTKKPAEGKASTGFLYSGVRENGS